MRGGRLTSRQLVVLIILAALFIEIPLALYFFTRTSGEGVTIVTTGDDGGGLSTPLPVHPTATDFEPDETALANCTEQTCVEQAVGNIAYRRGPEAAFRIVDRRFNGGVDAACHRVVHIVGAATLARNRGNVSRTFAQGSSICWSGYYHGVLERAFANVKTYDAKSLGAKARTVCADESVRKLSWLAFQCLHGLGHGLMITTGLQLPLSLKVCKQLAAAWDQTSCKGGVFMENFATSYGGQSPWVRDDDILYPCTSVAKVDKFPCYQLSMVRVFRVIGLNWPGAASICAGVERAWRTTCFGSFGQNASVLSMRRVPVIISTCALTRPYGRKAEAECIRYAAMDIVGTYERGKEAARLCDSTPPELALRAPCYEAIGYMIRYLTAAKAKRLAECKALASKPSDAAACIEGSRQRRTLIGLAR
jgi:hypothetical protein